MQREIKFRAWNTHSHTMVDLKSITPLALDEKMKMDGLFIPFTETLKPMQYTGLHDKNGKEIYEGDVLSFYDIHGVVKFGMHDDEVYNGWYVEVNATGTHCELNKSFSGAEVIGNIHESPELLEVSE